MHSEDTEDPSSASDDGTDLTVVRRDSNSDSVGQQGSEDTLVIVEFGTSFSHAAGTLGFKIVLEIIDANLANFNGVGVVASGSEEVALNSGRGCIDAD